MERGKRRKTVVRGLTIYLRRARTYIRWMLVHQRGAVCHHECWSEATNAFAAAFQPARATACSVLPSCTTIQSPSAAGLAVATYTTPASTAASVATSPASPVPPEAPGAHTVLRQGI